MRSFSSGLGYRDLDSVFVIDEQKPEWPTCVFHKTTSFTMQLDLQVLLRI